jgi:3-hydroxyisobutyrate dehydrogenase-like beta-hydroxyacid dehydrogenase
MGSNIAKRLLKAGHIVYGRDINPTIAAAMADIGVNIVNAPKDLVDIVHVTLLSLPWPLDVREVVLGCDGLLSKSGILEVIVDMSTVDPFTTQHLAEESGKKGIGYLDAPVLGRPQNCGNWALPIGGESAYLRKCHEILQILAQKIIHVGPSGTGNIVKLLNNMMFGAINAVTAEVFAICAKSGLDPNVFYETVSNSGAATVSNLFKEVGSKILSKNFSPVFSIELLRKDMLLGIRMANRLNVPILVSNSNQLINNIAELAGCAKEDTASVIKIYEQIAKANIKQEGSS